MPTQRVRVAWTLIRKTSSARLLRRLRRRAARHAGAGRVREALDIQRQVIALAPDDAQSFLQLGLLHRREGEIPQATRALERARTLAPREPNACAALAEIYLDASRFDEAIRECKSLIELVPARRPGAASAQLSLFPSRPNGTGARCAPGDRPLVSHGCALTPQTGHAAASAEQMARRARRVHRRSYSSRPKTSLEYARSGIGARSMLNRQQMQMILTLAADDRLFQLRLARDARGSHARARVFTSPRKPRSVCPAPRHRARLRRRAIRHEPHRPARALQLSRIRLPKRAGQPDSPSCRSSPQLGLGQPDAWLWAC